MTEIIKDLWVGDLWHVHQAADAGMVVICVLEERPEEEPLDAIHVPLMKFLPAYEDAQHALVNHPLSTYEGQWRTNMINLAIICYAIDAGREMGRAVYVHCAAGVERSPLVIAWYLHTRYNKTLDDAYAEIQSKRSVVMDRRSYLPHPFNME